MNYDLTPARARARYFIEHVTNETVDADLDDSTAAEWPPLLDRRTAAQFLGVGMKWLSDISGNGPRGGRLPKVMVRGKVYWRLEASERSWEHFVEQHPEYRDPKHLDAMLRAEGKEV